MDEQNQNIDTPAPTAGAPNGGRPQRLVFETPNKAISYVAFVAGIIGIIGAILTILASTPVLGGVVIGEVTLRNIFWFTSFGLLVITVVLSLVSNAKRIGSSVITHKAEICGIITAVILIISTFASMFFR